VIVLFEAKIGVDKKKPKKLLKTRIMHTSQYDIKKSLNQY